MIRLFVLITTLVLSVAAQADKTTLTTCSRNERAGGKTLATIGVYSADDGTGHIVRSLTASTFVFDDVQVPANDANCNRTTCRHNSGDEVVPMAISLTPHYRSGSDVLSAITVTLSSDIMRDSFTLTNCKVTDHYPRAGEDY